MYQQWEVDTWRGCWDRMLVIYRVYKGGDAWMLNQPWIS